MRPILDREREVCSTLGSRSVELGRSGVLYETGKSADEPRADGMPAAASGRSYVRFGEGGALVQATKALFGRAEPQRPFPSPRARNEVAGPA